MDCHLLKIYRTEYPESTSGKLYILEHGSNHEYFFGYTLEDLVRQKGIKIKGETAIPYNDEDNLYKIGVRQSPKFGKTVVIYTSIEVRDGIEVFILEYNGIRFEYILFHGGNDIEDTDGCVLIAENQNPSKNIIWGSLKKELTLKVENLLKTCDVRLLIQKQ